MKGICHTHNKRAIDLKNKKKNNLNILALSCLAKGASLTIRGGGEGEIINTDKLPVQLTLAEIFIRFVN